MYKNIIDLSKECPSISITIKAGELLEMAEYCVQSTHKALEQQITDANTESILSPVKTAEVFDVNLSTLQR
jgi:hypothetical protein